MNKNQILIKIRRSLKSKVDKEYKQGAENFFREKIKIYGVRLPIVRKISGKCFSTVQDQDTKEILTMCEELLKTGLFEEITIAFDWAYRLRKNYKKSDFSLFEKWLKNHVSNWGNCDDFCGHLLGYFLCEYSDLIPRIKKWTDSRNRWVRRAAAVIFIYPVRKKKYLKDIFWTADKLLLDKDDMVQKGYGWMLKEASNVFQKEVFDFVMKRKNKMPRLALRYAIEKMPQSMKKKAIKK